MNRLQGLKTQREYLVSLNPVRRLDEAQVIKRLEYTHPQYTEAAIASQAQLSRLQGQGGIYYCGSYFGYGFHEDAVRSGFQVAEQFGIQL
jgi:predicted NAD/FAD-binding protein